MSLFGATKLWLRIFKTDACSARVHCSLRSHDVRWFMCIAKTTIAWVEKSNSPKISHFINNLIWQKNDVFSIWSILSCSIRNVFVACVVFAFDTRKSVCCVYQYQIEKVRARFSPYVCVCVWWHLKRAIETWAEREKNLTWLDVIREIRCKAIIGSVNRVRAKK